MKPAQCLKEQLFAAIQNFVDSGHGNETDVARILHEMINFYISDPDRSTAEAYVRAKMKRGGMWI